MTSNQNNPERQGNPADRRKHPRLPESRPAWVQRSSATHNVTMKDLSRGGACFISPRPVSVGKPIQLQIGCESAGAAVDAIVIRNVERFDGQYEVSVRFTDDRSCTALASRFPSRAARMVAH